MPSPIGHLLAGYTVARGAEASTAPRHLPHALLLGLVLANLPDVDFLPGLLVGRPTQYHRLATHSLGAMLLAGACVGLVAWWRTGRFLPTFVFACGAYGSHLLLDAFGRDLTGLDGIPLFWPLSGQLVVLPWPIFAGYRLGDSNASLVDSLLDVAAPMGVLREIALLLPVALVARRAARRRWRREEASQTSPAVDDPVTGPPPDPRPSDVIPADPAGGQEDAARPVM